MRVDEMSLEQHRQLIDTEQVWNALEEARRRMRAHAGTLVWREVSGREYLVKVDGPASRRRTRSLGPRSPETEHILEEFTAGKQRAREMFKGTSARLGDMARLNRAMRLARVPATGAKVVRGLHAQGALGRSLTVVGTYALYAYEAAAGVFVNNSLLATGDMDVLFDARRMLRLGYEEEPPSLLAMLKEIDASYTRVESVPFRAVNAQGFYVDLIKRTPRDVVASSEPDALGGADDLQAAHIPNMRWIVNAPKFKAMAIGSDGLPVPMACPDPRAFALYKLWMGRQDRSRDPIKRRRDVQQARVAADIVHEYLPQLEFEPEHLTAFPRRVTAVGMDESLFRMP